MNIELLNKIKSDILTLPYIPKERSWDFAGVYLHSNSPFKLTEHQAPIHSFRVFSKFDYPIYFFISPDARNDEFEQLLDIYPNIIPILIPTLINVIGFNYFSICELPYLIPETTDQLLYIQSDGFLLKSGWEEQTKGYSWLGAKWKDPIKVIENTFNFPLVQIGNGGCNFRRRSKMLEVLKLVEENGGQDNIVKGIKINDEIKNRGPFLAEDLFFCYFGFGSGIFEPVDLDWIDSFAIEPITWQQYKSGNVPYLFHRIDE